MVIYAKSANRDDILSAAYVASAGDTISIPAPGEYAKSNFTPEEQRLRHLIEVGNIRAGYLQNLLMQIAAKFPDGRLNPWIKRSLEGIDDENTLIKKWENMPTIAIVK